MNCFFRSWIYERALEYMWKPFAWIWNGIRNSIQYYNLRIFCISYASTIYIHLVIWIKRCKHRCKKNYSKSWKNLTLYSRNIVCFILFNKDKNLIKTLIFKISSVIEWHVSIWFQGQFTFTTAILGKGESIFQLEKKGTGL